MPSCSCSVQGVVNCLAVHNNPLRCSYPVNEVKFVPPTSVLVLHVTVLFCSSCEMYAHNVAIVHFFLGNKVTFPLLLSLGPRAGGVNGVMQVLNAEPDKVELQEVLYPIPNPTRS